MVLRYHQSFPQIFFFFLITFFLYNQVLVHRLKWLRHKMEAVGIFSKEMKKIIFFMDYFFSRFIPRLILFSFLNFPYYAPYTIKLKKETKFCNSNLLPYFEKMGENSFLQERAK